MGQQLPSLRGEQRSTVAYINRSDCSETRDIFLSISGGKGGPSFFSHIGGIGKQINLVINTKLTLCFCNEK